MRRDFVKQMLLEMERDPGIVFLTADLGFNALEEIKKRFPERFINVGIAEQHMVGMAAGLALEGKKVIAYSIASFSAMRPYEQIRTDVCYHDLDVKIIGTGGGVNYPTHGVTHHTIEDIAIMNVLPNMKVFNPAYGWEATEATKAMIREKGPAYIRLGKNPGVDYMRSGFKWKTGKGYVVREGEKIVLISTGNVLDIVIAAAERLEKDFGPVAVLSLPTLKPFDIELVAHYAMKAEGVFTIEEHNVIGGLGSITAEGLWKKGVPRRKFTAFGFQDEFQKAVGDRDHLLNLVGIEANTIADKVKKIMRAEYLVG